MIKETETVYHFYAGKDCILHSVKEEDLSYTKLPAQKIEDPSLDEHSY